MQIPMPKKSCNLMKNQGKFVPDLLPFSNCTSAKNLRQLSGCCVLGVVWKMCLNTVFLFVLDLGLGRQGVPHPPSIRMCVHSVQCTKGRKFSPPGADSLELWAHGTATAATYRYKRWYMRKGDCKLEQCRSLMQPRKTVYKHSCFYKRKNRV